MRVGTKSGVHHGYVGENNDTLVQVEILTDVYVCIGGGISMREARTTPWIIDKEAGRAGGRTDTRAGAMTLQCLWGRRGSRIVLQYVLVGGRGDGGR